MLGRLTGAILPTGVTVVASLSGLEGLREKSVGPGRESRTESEKFGGGGDFLDKSKATIDSSLRLLSLLFIASIILFCSSSSSLNFLISSVDLLLRDLN